MKNVLQDIAATARRLLGNRRALLLFFATYIALLATLALFVTTREATVKEVLLTFATLVAAPALFFLLQGMCVNFAESEGAFELLRRAMRIFWRLILASLPFIILSFGLFLLFRDIEAHFTPRLAREAARTEWPLVILSTVRLLVFGLALPLASIHLWLALLRDEARNVLRNIAPVMSRAFAPRSVVTYVCGLVLFGLVPYFLIASRTPFERAWLELTVLGTRLVLAFSLMLLGWIVTVGALHRGMNAEG